MKTNTFTSAAAMVAAFITAFFDRVSAAPVAAPDAATSHIEAAPIEARDAHVGLSNVEFAPRDIIGGETLTEREASVQGDTGEWLIQARRDE